MPRNDFDFLLLFAEIFDYFGASPVSLTPAKLAIFIARYQWHRRFMTSPVSTTPVTCFAGVIDTGEAPEKSNISANIRKKIEIITRFVYWGQEKLFEEKNQRWKIWWHCPFKASNLSELQSCWGRIYVVSRWGMRRWWPWSLGVTWLPVDTELGMSHDPYHLRLGMVFPLQFLNRYDQVYAKLYSISTPSVVEIKCCPVGHGKTAVA